MKKWLPLILAGISLVLLLILFLFDKRSPPDHKRDDIPKEVVITGGLPSQNVTVKESYRIDFDPDAGSAVISDVNLPPAVLEAQKSKAFLEVQFYLKNFRHDLPIISHGTGYFFIPGYIITARHIYLDILSSGAIFGFPYQVGPDGIPRGKDYEYKFSGSITTGKEIIRFPLSLESMGEMGTLTDLMVLKVDDYTLNNAGNFKSPNDGDKNPYQALLSTAVFATNASLLEKVYLSGFNEIITRYIKDNGLISHVLSSRRNFTFEGEITQRIENMPINKLGLKRKYEIRGNAEFGFSGGPVFNARGEIIGLIVEKTEYFVYAISSLDILDFLRKKGFIKN